MTGVLKVKVDEEWVELPAGVTGPPGPQGPQGPPGAGASAPNEVSVAASAPTVTAGYPEVWVQTHISTPTPVNTVPFIVAHRTTLASADDRTEEQFTGEALLSNKVNGVEIDVQVPSDYLTTGKAYLCHDATINRTSPNGGTGTLTAMTSAQLDAAGILDLQTFLEGIDERYQVIFAQVYDLNPNQLLCATNILNASKWKDRIVFVANAAGSSGTATAQMSLVRVRWSGMLAVFQMTAANWTFYQALATTYGITHAALPPDDATYVANRSHVATLKAAGIKVIGSVLNSTSIPLAYEDNLWAILSDVTDSIVSSHPVPDNVPLTTIGLRAFVDGEWQAVGGEPSSGTSGDIGPQGPPGPTGATGPQGPQGVPGTGGSGTNLDQIENGLESHNRRYCTSAAVSSPTGTLRLTYMTADKSFTANSVILYTGSTPASGTPPTLCQHALFEEDPTTKDLTRLALSVSNPALFIASNTEYVIPLGAGIPIVAGRRYCVAQLIVGTGTFATFAGTTSNVGNIMVQRHPRVNAQRTAQASIPTSITDAQLLAAPTGNQPYAAIIP